MVSEEVDPRVGDAIRIAVKAGAYWSAARKHPTAALLCEACARRWSSEATTICNLVAERAHE